jgi:hypothetical protein
LYSYFDSRLPLPEQFRSRRETRRIDLAPQETCRLFDQQTAGCIRHWWMTFSTPELKEQNKKFHGRHLWIRMTLDDADVPNVEMPVDVFFAILLEQDPYPIDSHFIKVLPVNGMNCYFPIWFQSRCTVDVINYGTATSLVWFMANWQQYKPDTSLPPYRFHAVFNEAKPAEGYGSYLMADITGKGWVGGFAKGVRPKDPSDCWYHTGGDLWLIDGETDPHVIRGIGSEDIFGYSFGLHSSCHEWTGTPLVQKDPPGPDPTGVSETAAYRFFGPDPVVFNDSLVFRFGSRANDVESVVYYYVDKTSADKHRTESERQWQIVGPFECNNDEDFDRAEFPELPEEEWQARVDADFGQYRGQRVKRSFTPAMTESEHGWVDFSRFLRTPARTNIGTQPLNVSAYAISRIHCSEASRKRIRIGFDDGLKLWVNGSVVYSGRHEQGFLEATVDSVPFQEGMNTVMVKLNNFDNVEWRAWAFSFHLET